MSRPSILRGISFADDLRPAEDSDFPDYGNVAFDSLDKSCLSLPTSTTTTTTADADSTVPSITTANTTRSNSPLPTPTVADDTAVRDEPSRHVDYLSHNWQEEDIAASWRHIVSQRKTYGPQSRLENASWRTWAKSKNRLATVSPDMLNWYARGGNCWRPHLTDLVRRCKESDVTWLYGPLKPAVNHPEPARTADSSPPPLSTNSSFVSKKPILKKRTVSEAMLHESLSASSLLQQAAASVQAQQRRTPRRVLARRDSDIVYSPSEPPSVPSSRDDDCSSHATTLDQGTPTESREARHIRFDETVEQCIAVDRKDGLCDDDDLYAPAADCPLAESSSDEVLTMLHRRRPSQKREDRGSGRLSRSNSMSNSMIETIPATTLKSRTDSPELTADAQHHTFGKSWHKRLSPSPSQETLRPARTSRNFLLPEDDDDDDDFDTTSWSFGAANPRSSLGASAGPSGGSRDYAPTHGYEGVEGMRRTESGMFMPYDEDEDDVVAAGLFGRVSETINTVRDIGYVIWNVGFRNNGNE